MPKLIVQIDIPVRFFATADDLRKQIQEPIYEWFNEDGLLTVDEDFLTRDTKDDSFFVFKLIRVED